MCKEKCSVNDTNTGVCGYCNERHLKADLIYTENGVAYCKDCFSSTPVRCEHCGELIHHKHVFSVYTDGYRQNHEIWCADCVNEVGYQCKVCGRYFDDPYDGVQVFRFDIVCGECYDKKYAHRCANCKHDLLEEDYRNDGSFCEDCYLKHADE